MWKRLFAYFRNEEPEVGKEVTVQFKPAPYVPVIGEPVISLAKSMLAGEWTETSRGKVDNSWYEVHNLGHVKHYSMRLRFAYGTHRSTDIENAQIWVHEMDWMTPDEQKHMAEAYRTYLIAKRTEAQQKERERFNVFVQGEE